MENLSRSLLDIVTSSKSSCGEEADWVRIFIAFPARHSHPALVGDSEFQLITWSKDRTLRFWPIDSEVMAVNYCLHLLLAPTLNYFSESGVYTSSESGHCYLRWP